MLFLLVVTPCFVLAISGMRLRQEAGRVAKALRSALADDARFKSVTVSRTTSGHVFLFGSVSSNDDLQALNAVVERAHFASKPVMLIEVHPSTSEQNAAKVQN